MEDPSRNPAQTPETRAGARPPQGGRTGAAESSCAQREAASAARREGGVSPGPQLAAGPPPVLYDLLEGLAETLPSGPALLLLAEADLEFLRCAQNLPADTGASREVRALWEDVRRLGRSGRGSEAAEALEHFWMLLDAWLRECAGARNAGESHRLNSGVRGGLCEEASA
ncbi:MAG: hypothetical protein QXO51_00615 [Halobacteria archaeon]